MSVGGHLYLFKTCLNCLNSLIRTKHCKSHEVNLKSGDLVYLMSASSKVFVKKDCFLHLRGKTPAHKKHLSVQQRPWKIYFRKKTNQIYRWRACIFCDQGFPLKSGSLTDKTRGVEHCLDVIYFKCECSAKFCFKLCGKETWKLRCMLWHRIAAIHIHITHSNCQIKS